MTESPVRTRVDADRILRRAAEIEGSDDGRRLTLEELRLIAGEAGFGLEAVERAIAEARAGEPGEVQRPPVRRTGLLVTRLSTVRHVQATISSEQLLDGVRLFQPYRDSGAVAGWDG